MQKHDFRLKSSSNSIVNNIHVKQNKTAANFKDMRGKTHSYNGLNDIFFHFLFISGILMSYILMCN